MKMAENYDVFDSKMDIFYDKETNTVLVGPYEVAEGDFEKFVRTRYPNAHIEFTTPKLRRNIKAEKKVKAKDGVKAQIAEIEQKLQILKHRGDTGQAYALIREKEGLEKKLAEM